MGGGEAIMVKWTLKRGATSLETLIDDLSQAATYHRLLLSSGLEH